MNSTLHDRQRRHERQIDEDTLHEARRYGIGRIRSDYAGHVFIYDPKTNSAITSWKQGVLETRTNQQQDKRNRNGGRNSPNKSRKKRTIVSTSGTQFERPIMIAPSEDHQKPAMVAAHEDLAKWIRKYPEEWSSNTVIVVDMSGSMREDDVNGARCRSDGVWTTLARDYVKKQLKEETCSVYDVVSVVLMRENAHAIIEYEPMDWVLYNKLVSFREVSSVDLDELRVAPLRADAISYISLLPLSQWDNDLRPRGHGFYKPALEKASEILSFANQGSCALSLLFFSDGKPSDYFKNFRENDRFSYLEHEKVNAALIATMGRLASQFGRRLNIHCIGMADANENFSTLQRMVEEAKSYHVQATFHRPSLLSTSSLSAIMSSSIATSLSCKTELMSLKSGKMRSVRTYVEREKCDAPDDDEITDKWRVFRGGAYDKFVVRVWKWNSKARDFCQLIDPRCHTCFKVVADSNYHIKSTGGSMCSECSACFFCAECKWDRAHLVHQRNECPSMAQDRRRGHLAKGRPGKWILDCYWTVLTTQHKHARSIFV
jgi:hypothetical protein